MKSANARSVLTLPLSTNSPLTVSMALGVAFFAAVDAPIGGRSEVCIRSEAVSTNCPTAALKPERNALNGWSGLLAGVDRVSNERSRATYVVSSHDAI